MENWHVVDQRVNVNSQPVKYDERNPDRTRERERSYFVLLRDSSSLTRGCIVVHVLLILG